MRERPLCSVCLVFLCIIGILVKAGVITGTAGSRDTAFTKLAESGEDSVLRGTVYRKEEKETYQILYLKNIQLQGKQEPSQSITYSIKSCILYDKTFQNIPLGGVIKSKGTIKLFEKAGNPGNFEQDFYYAKQGIAFAFQSKVLIKEKVKPAPYEKILAILDRVQKKWQSILMEGAGEENGAVLSAILTGEKSEMSPEIKELYQKNGIGHILAISGLHISFIGLGTYHLLRKMGCPFLWAGVLSLFLLLCYMGMVGNSVSVVRAVIMLAIRMGADIVGRTYDLPTSLSVAAAITAIWRPLYLKDAAFLLSYGAILGILITAPIIEVLCKKESKFRVLLSGAGIQLFLLPIVLYFYYEFPPYSILLNLIVIPLLSVIMGGTFAGSFFALAGESAKLKMIKQIGEIVLSGCGWILQLYKWLGTFCMKLPGARIVCGRPRWWQILLFYSILLLLSVGALQMAQKEKESVPGRKTAVCYGIVMTFCVVLCSWNFRGGKNLQITMLDVGQGDCIFLRTPSGLTVLTDGGSSDVKQVGKYRMEPFLLYNGVKEVDYVFVTHGDSDHCNGISELIECGNMGVRIKHLVLPAVWRNQEGLCRLAEQAAENDVKVSEIQPGMELERGGVQMRCIFPGVSDTDLEVNEGSLVLMVRYDRFKMLLTGDIEGKGEERMCMSEELKNCSVLKTAHHGSENSTPEALLQKLSPEIALISAGEGNSYGHPHPALLERLKRCGCRIYQTMECGAILLETDGEKIKIRTFR